MRPGGGQACCSRPRLDSAAASGGSVSRSGEGSSGEVKKKKKELKQEVHYSVKLSWSKVTPEQEQQEVEEACGQLGLSPVWNNLAPLTSLSVSLRPSIYKGSGGFCGRGSDLMGLEWQGCCYLSGGVDGGR